MPALNFHRRRSGQQRHALRAGVGVIIQLAAGLHRHDAGRQVPGSVELADQAFELHARSDLGGRSLSDGGHHLRLIGPVRVGRPLERGNVRDLGMYLQLGPHHSIARDGRQRAVQPAQDIRRVDSQHRQAEALLDALDQVLVAGGDQAAVLAGRADRVFDRQQLLGHPRAFPLPAIAGGRGIVGRSDQKHLDPFNGHELFDIASGADRFDHRHDQHVIVCFMSVFDEALPPGGGAFAADAAQALGRKTGERNRLAQLLGGFDPGNDDAVGPQVDAPA